MREVIAVLNKLVKKDIIEGYAIGGAMGVIFYTEPIVTKDLDVFILLKKSGQKIINLEPLYKCLKQAGHSMQGQYFIIGGIPVDFLPAYNPLIEEAIERAVKKRYEDIKVNVFRPEYLLAIALQIGRKHDLRKVDLLLEEATINRRLLKGILIHHNLLEKWRRYEGKG